MKSKRSFSSSSDSLESVEKKISKTQNPVDWSEMMPATGARDYMNKDPLLTWLKYYSSRLSLQKPELLPHVIRAANTGKSKTFMDFIMTQGVEFEESVIQYICKTFGGDMVAEIGGEMDAKSPAKVEETLQAMNRGVPIIHSAVLHNYENKTYGIPDLLVRSDWFETLFKESPIEAKEKNRSAPLLRDVFNPSSPPKYHYRVIDVKFSTIPLRVDGVHILNAGCYPAYKSQVYIYNEALGKLQGYTPPHAYIMGRKWKLTTKGEKYKGKTCFEKLGIVDFIDVDKEIKEKTANAVQWYQDVVKHGAEWNVSDAPLPRPELYPNMSNQFDYPWHQVKQKLAEQIEEITSLWMCGVIHRQRAHAQGVIKWTDPRCTSALLGFGAHTNTHRVLDRILSINRDSRLFKVEPRFITNNDDNWQQKRVLEFFIDFETINDVFCNFSKMPEAKSITMIFNIGVGYIEPFTKEWIFKSFMVDRLTFEEEERICTEFSNYVRQEADFYNCNDVLCFHWSCAENWQWEAAIKRHGYDRAFELCWILPSDANDGGFKPKWFDMLKLFRKEPIVIKGCLGFGLKQVAKTLYSHGLIKIVWEEDASCADGTSAMLMAHNANKIARGRGVSMRDLPQMKEIAKYNEVDCRSLQEILSYLREHHTSLDENLGDEML